MFFLCAIKGCDEFGNGEEDVYEHLNCQNEAEIDKHNKNSTTKIDETIISIQTTKKKNQSNLRVPQICLLCKEVCVDKKALNAHMKKKHKKSQRHPVKCKYIKHTCLHCVVPVELKL